MRRSCRRESGQRSQGERDRLKPPDYWSQGERNRLKPTDYFGEICRRAGEREGRGTSGTTKSDEILLGPESTILIRNNLALSLLLIVSREGLQETSTLVTRGCFNSIRPTLHHHLDHRLGCRGSRGSVESLSGGVTRSSDLSWGSERNKFC